MSPFMRATDMALVVCAHLAKQPGRTVATPTLVSELQLPSSHLSKVLQLLGRRGVLERRRGTRGGYAVGEKIAKSLTALEVVEAIEGRIAVSPQAPGASREVQEMLVSHMRRTLNDLKVVEL